MDIGISEIFSALIGLIAGLTIGVSINIKKSKISQKSNIAGGDVIGGNKNTND